MKDPLHIYQVQPQDCGPASLKMLLAYLYKDERYLFLWEQWPRPLSLKQILTIMQEYGVVLKGYRLHHPSSIRGIHRPFLAVQKTPHTHLVAIIPYKNLYLRLDPNEPPSRLKEPFQEQSFAGIVLVVHHIHSQAAQTVKKMPQLVEGFIPISLLGYLFILSNLSNRVPTLPWLLSAPLSLALVILWFLYLFKTQITLDDYMQKTFYSLIDSADQYQRFHQWKQGFLGLPLLKLYRLLVLLSLYAYLMVASPWFFAPLFAHHVLILGFTHLIEKKRQPLKSQLMHEESHLKYPLINVQPLSQIQLKVHRYMRYTIQIYALSFSVALVAMVIYGWMFPYRDFLTWISGVSLPIIHHVSLKKLRDFQKEKQRWRQIGYTFLNQKTYVKIKA